MARVARATSTEVELARPRLSTSPADLNGPRCLDVVKTPHLGCPVMPAQAARERRAHSPSVNNPLQQDHEQRADNAAQPRARVRVARASHRPTQTPTWSDCGSTDVLQ